MTEHRGSDLEVSLSSASHCIKVHHSPALSRTKVMIRAIGSVRY